MILMLSKFKVGGGGGGGARAGRDSCSETIVSGGLLSWFEASMLSVFISLMC